jgi:hypothetical protein
MSKLVFLWYLITGTITPSDVNDDRQMYTISKDELYVEYAYKEEIINWIKTDEFVFDETL